MENNNETRDGTEEKDTQPEKEVFPVKKTSSMRTFFEKIELKKRAEQIKTKTTQWMHNKTGDTQKVKTKIKGYAKNIGVLLLTVLIIFLLFEIGFRIADNQPPAPKRNILIKHSMYNPFLIFGPSFSQADRQGTLEENRGFAIWNPQGFRLPDNIQYEPPPDEYRIFALGGSTTEDMANGKNVHWCGVAEDLLDETRVFGNKKPRCINAGSSGYTTAHSLVRLQFDLLNFKPQMITVMNVINDFTVSYFPIDPQTQRYNYGNKYFNPTFTEETNLRKLLFDKSKVLTKLEKKLKNIQTKLTAKKIPAKDGTIIYSNMRFTNESLPMLTRLYYNNLKSIVAVAKEHNITVVLMSEPMVFTDEKIAMLFGHENYNKDIFYPEKEKLQLDLELYNGIVQMVAEEEDVSFIDMYTFMGHDERYFVDAAHYTAEGSERFGYIYTEELRKIFAEEEKKQKEKAELYDPARIAQILGNLAQGKGIKQPVGISY
ncbi:TPA: hypothetical protein HA249_06850 [Candidatus Woesearchaeota archaeon]|nr:hypothetical protein [Candidatus Woesearchaeota archaeon]HIH47357.1 hypothetical protein [Candidatus Woesearchaeota archaeon]